MNRMMTSVSEQISVHALSHSRNNMTYAIAVPGAMMPSARAGIVGALGNALDPSAATMMVQSNDAASNVTATTSAALSLEERGHMTSETNQTLMPAAHDMALVLAAHATMMRVMMV
jgi:hypothetical protein